jgi:energy-coupling factor transporter ATP-binding protein EcfA2
MNEERITYFGQTDARNKKVTFGIKAKDRTKHVYVIGKTGMGKSTLLENMAVQDIKNGEGMAFIDPHGKTAELLLEYVPEHRQKDVVYFAPFDMEHPIAFNVLESVDPDKRHLVVSGLMSTFKKIWQDAWSARMEYILTNTLLALLEYPGATLLGVNRMLSDKNFRNQVITHITDSSVKAFWTQEFANYTERMAAEAVPAIQNKIGQFTANALIRNMIGQPKSSFDIREMMDNSKIFIINLSKGRIGEANANLLGGMLITKIYLAALSRADTPDRILKTMPNFYLFVDEFQSFANESFADILSEARKYKLNLTIAHQYIEQMEEEVRAAVFGNVGTMIVFRVGAFDAEVLEKEFMPQFTAEDLVNLGIFQTYLKLMIDGISSQPFSATTLPPISKPESSSMQSVIEMSRKQFAHSRAEVEKAIDDWMAPIKAPQKANGSVTNKATTPQAQATNSHTNTASHSATNTTSQTATTTTPNTAVTSSNPSIPPVVVAQMQVTTSSQAVESKPVPPINNDKVSLPAETPIAKSEQPFKKAFEEIKIEGNNKNSTKGQINVHSHGHVSEHKPVSLRSLDHKNQPRNTSKDAQPARVNDLKNALASILATQKPKEGTTEKHEKKEEKQDHNANTHVNTKNEIPEEKLREMLKVE